MKRSAPEPPYSSARAVSRRRASTAGRTPVRPPRALHVPSRASRRRAKPRAPAVHRARRARVPRLHAPVRDPRDVVRVSRASRKRGTRTTLRCRRTRARIVRGLRGAPCAPDVTRARRVDATSEPSGPLALRRSSRQDVAISRGGRTDPGSRTAVDSMSRGAGSNRWTSFGALGRPRRHCSRPRRSAHFDRLLQRPIDGQRVGEIRIGAARTAHVPIPDLVMTRRRARHIAAHGDC